MIDKARLRRSFAAAAAGYDAAAAVQREVAARLLAGLPAMADVTNLLDLGCGTGHGLSLLAERFPGRQPLAVDFALPMLAGLAAPRLCADAEALPLCDASIDLVWSNLTLQWCDAPRFFAEVARVLRRGGRLAASTLGPGTFAELRRAFAGVDAYRHTLAFASAEQLAAALAGAGLSLCALDTVSLTRRHADLAGLLAEVRGVGANRVTGPGARRGLMGRAARRRFEAAWEEMREGGALPLSYEVIFLHAEKQAIRMS